MRRALLTPSAFSARERLRVLTQSTRPFSAPSTAEKKSSKKKGQKFQFTYNPPRENLYDAATKDEPVKYRSAGTIRHLVLNRPSALHSLNTEMIRFLRPRIEAAELNRDTNALILTHMDHTKGFCAGGDVKALYTAGQPGGNVQDQMDFFKEEYQLNYATSNVRVPYVPYMDGLTMGGGVGLSVHSRFRVASHDTVFAMPETSIGFYPDVGGSYFLPRLDGELGMYLGLTGARLYGFDAYLARVATHFITPYYFNNMVEMLVGMHGGRGSVKEMLESVHEMTVMNMDQKRNKLRLAPYLDAIDRCFSKGSVEEIIEAIKLETGNMKPWADATLERLAKASPTSLKVTYAQLRKGAKLTLAECLQMEYRMSLHFMRAKDFYIGVRSMLITKDQNPQWSMALPQVTDGIVDSYFDAISGIADLTFTEPRRLILERKLPRPALGEVSHPSDWNSLPDEYINSQGLDDVKNEEVEDEEGLGEGVKIDDKDLMDSMLRLNEATSGRNGQVGGMRKVDVLRDLSRAALGLPESGEAVAAEIDARQALADLASISGEPIVEEDEDDEDDDSFSSSFSSSSLPTSTSSRPASTSPSPLQSSLRAGQKPSIEQIRSAAYPAVVASDLDLDPTLPYDELSLDEKLDTTTEADVGNDDDKDQEDVDPSDPFDDDDDEDEDEDDIDVDEDEDEYGDESEGDFRVAAGASDPKAAEEADAAGGASNGDSTDAYGTEKAAKPE